MDKNSKTRFVGEKTLWPGYLPDPWRHWRNPQNNQKLPASWCDFCSSPQPQSRAHFPPLNFPASAVSELLVMRKVHTDPHGRPSLLLSNEAFLLYSLGTTLPITEWRSVALRGGRSAVTLSSESCSLPTYCSLLLSDSLALIRILIQS